MCWLVGDGSGLFVCVWCRSAASTRLLPVPSRRSRRWYRASRPYSGDSFPVPREIESLLPESARSTFKRKSPKLSAEDIAAFDGSALRCREYVSTLDWQQAGVALMFQRFASCLSPENCRFTLSLLLGNAVLCRRDTLLTSLPSSLSQQDILELRSSTFSGPFLFDVEVISRVRRQMREDLQVQAGILALKSSSSAGRLSGSTSTSRHPAPRLESRPFRGGRGGGSSSSRGRQAKKQSSAGGKGTPARHQR